MSVKLDYIDQHIIAALREDGRTPYARIADELDVSAGMIRQRTQRLVDEGVIRVTAITNPFLMGYPVMALIGVNVAGNSIRKVAERVAEFDEVIYLVLATGSYDLLVEVVCRDNPHLVEFLTERLHSVEGVRDTETFIYLEIMKETQV